MITTCEVENRTDYSEIDSRGFLLIRSFLNEDQIQRLQTDFEAAPLEVNANYSVRRISAAVQETLQGQLDTVNQRIAAESSVRVDLLNDGVYFATYSEKSTLTSLRPGPQQFPWHQDHETYWLWNDMRNYLNFYLPIVKPVVEKSNLTVVPFDRFEQRVPDLHRKMIGRGASRVLPSGKSWIIKDDDQGGKIGRLPFDPSEIEETPQLRAGDLLVLRGDIIHRTQDASTRRVAASFRYINSETIVPRTSLSRGSVAKALMMLNARYLFEPAFELFDQSAATELTAGKLDAHLKRVMLERREGTQSANSGRLAFLSRLLSEKLRRR
ncbi:phytanoyl-CoA dioxygenase family protein [Neorhodopirellula pilleata]|uniref:Phytanoyl-CoA dioxygenase (PhyH) n=1 Tax=Neorhodopirellula pilleata TaxID=2714738 RepID=A0A5C6AFG7_9BACT|nr:phytanoyl-CoA dioxygenase family protein [Neorhodopirellula pilleata]TWT98714.1 Phytanoyl-CoA dioxygenase (PhyH) [Neorhodopirellula pilleata]